MHFSIYLREKYFLSVLSGLRPGFRVCLLAGFALFITQLSAQAPRYQFVMGEFSDGNVHIEDPSSLTDGRITEDYVTMRYGDLVDQGAGEFKFMDPGGMAPNQAMFMFDLKVGETMFSFKYDKGSIYKVQNGQETLVYDGGFAVGDITRVGLNGGQVSVTYLTAGGQSPQVLDQSLMFGAQFELETTITPFGTAPFFGEYVLTEDEVPPLIEVNFVQREIWVNEGESFTISADISRQNNSGEPIRADVELLSDGQPHLFTYFTTSISFGATSTIASFTSVTNEAEGGDGTYILGLTNVEGLSAVVGAQDQLIVHVIDSPEEEEEALRPTDLRIIAFDNDIGEDDDLLTVTNLVELAPGRTFQIVNGSHDQANSFYGPLGDGDQIVAQEITYIGDTPLPEKSKICFRIPASDEPRIVDILLDGEPSSLFIASYIDDASRYLHLPIDGPSSLFLTSGIWSHHSQGSDLHGYVLDGLVIGADEASLPHDVSCTAISVPGTGGSFYGLFNCGDAFANADPATLSQDLIDPDMWVIKPSDLLGADDLTEAGVYVCSQNCDPCVDLFYPDNILGHYRVNYADPININGTVFMCRGDNLTLAVFPHDLYGWTWYDPSGEVIIDNYFFNKGVDNSFVEGVYYALGTDDFGCEIRYEVLVNTYAPPLDVTANYTIDYNNVQAVQNNAIEICTDTDIAIFIDQADFISWTWFDPNNQEISNSAILELSVDDTFVAGQYNANGIDQLGCNQSYSVDISISTDQLTVNLAGADYCLGHSSTVSSSVSGGSPPYSFFWSNGDMAETTLSTETRAGSYDYTLEVVDAKGCRGSSSITLDVNEAFGVRIEGDSYVCSEAGGLRPIRTLRADVYSGSISSNPNAYSYLWSTGWANRSLSIPSPNSSVYEQQTYSVTVTHNQSGCLAVAEHIITFDQAPNVQVAELVQNRICGGLSVEVAPNSNHSFVQISVDGGATYGYSLATRATTHTYALTDLAPGSYFVKARWENGNCPVDIGWVVATDTNCCQYGLRQACVTTNNVKTINVIANTSRNTGAIAPCNGGELITPDGRSYTIPSGYNRGVAVSVLDEGFGNYAFYANERNVVNTLEVTSSDGSRCGMRQVWASCSDFSGECRIVPSSVCRLSDNGCFLHYREQDALDRCAERCGNITYYYECINDRCYSRQFNCANCYSGTSSGSAYFACQDGCGAPDPCDGNPPCNDTTSNAPCCCNQSTIISSACPSNYFLNADCECEETPPECLGLPTCDDTASNEPCCCNGRARIEQCPPGTALDNDCDCVSECHNNDGLATWNWPTGGSWEVGCDSSGDPFLEFVLDGPIYLNCDVCCDRNSGRITADFTIGNQNLSDIENISCSGSIRRLRVPISCDDISSSTNLSVEISAGDNPQVPDDCQFSGFPSDITSTYALSSSDVSLLDGCQTCEEPACSNNVIAGNVWEDLNRDGAQDSGEPSLSGVRIDLINEDTDEFIASATSDASGNYRFDCFVNGRYYLQAHRPSGLICTLFRNDNDFTSNSCKAYLQPFSNSSRTADLGLWGTAILGDLVWLDHNGDGAKDQNEPGANLISVELLDQSDQRLASTTTNTNGSYAFTNLVPGTYKIRVNAPDGYEITGGKFNSSTQTTSLINLQSRRSKENFDAGLFETSGSARPPAGCESTTITLPRVADKDFEFFTGIALTSTPPFQGYSLWSAHGQPTEEEQYLIKNDKSTQCSAGSLIVSYNPTYVIRSVAQVQSMINSRLSALGLTDVDIDFDGTNVTITDPNHKIARVQLTSVGFDVNTSTCEIIPDSDVPRNNHVDLCQE